MRELLLNWIHEPLSAARLGGLTIAAALALCASILACASRLRRAGATSHQRGARVLGQHPARDWVAPLHRWRLLASARLGPLLGGEQVVCLAGEPLRLLDETKHFKLIGTTGTGKSTAIGQLLRTALLRGDRVLVSDPDATYWEWFGSPHRGDQLLNPFESHSRRWDLFAEISNDYDVEQLTSALISQAADPSSQEWRGYARTFLAAILRHCRDHGRADVAELWRLMTTAPADELRAVVAGSPAQPFLDPDNARMFSSIRSVATATIGPLQYVRTQRARPLSVRAWVRASHGSLFLPYRAGQIAALRSVISAWIRLALFEAMNQSPGEDQRLWFVVDELDALGAIDGLKDALARLRKYGGRCVLGLQSVAQVSGTYGSSDAQTIIENCTNTLILRCAGSESGGTAQFASRLIGEREELRRQVVRGTDNGRGWGRSPARSSRQISVQRVTDHAVLPSELEQLPDLHGYVKTASSSYWRRVRLRC